MWVPGTIVSNHDSEIAAETQGRIVWLSEIGEQLKQGDRIAQVDNHLWNLRLKENQANIKRLKASLLYNERQMLRLGKLAQTNSASRTQLDEITSNKDMVTHELEQAQLNQARTAYQLKHTEIIAPFDGQVVERRRELGEYIQVGQAIARLVDIDNKEVRLRAPLRVAAYLQTGMLVEVKNSRFAGQFKIRAIVPVGDEVSRSLEIRVSVDKDSWLVGAAVQVALPTDVSKLVVAVQRDALILREDGISVFRVTSTSTAEKIDVIPGIGRGPWVEIEGDLNAGDEVIVRGAERVRPGQAVKVVH